MAHFAKGQDTAPLTTVTMRSGSTKRVYLVGAGGDPKSPPAVSSKNPSIVSAKVLHLYEGKLGKWTVEIRALAKGDAELEGKGADGPKAVLAVKVVEPVALPDAATTEGMLVRLFLAEVRSPGVKGYNEADARKAMQWMRIVLANRLAHRDPGLFRAKGAKTLVDIVKAPGQVAGFGNYPNIDSKTAQRINEAVDIANDDSDSRQEAFSKYFGLAVEVATGELPKDPSKGLYGWRTEGSGSPGASFVAYDKPIMGNQFYTLK